MGWGACLAPVPPAPGSLSRGIALGLRNRLVTQNLDELVVKNKNKNKLTNQQLKDRRASPAGEDACC